VLDGRLALDRTAWRSRALCAYAQAAWRGSGEDERAAEWENQMLYTTA